jgi:predicted nucleic acid-binding protein
MDVCCLNRPLDDLEQVRVRLEAEAVTEIIQNCETNAWILVNSDIIEFEVARHSDVFKREIIYSSLKMSREYLKSTDAIEARAKELMQLSFKFHDALHLAFSEAGKVDIFLTTDDRLLRKAKQHQGSIQVDVENPTIWLINVLQHEDENNETNRN